MARLDTDDSVMTVRHDGTKGSDYGNLTVPCCVEDEGRPLGAALQEEPPNHPELLWSKGMVVSVGGKGGP